MALLLEDTMTLLLARKVLLIPFSDSLHSSFSSWTSCTRKRRRTFGGIINLDGGSLQAIRCVLYIGGSCNVGVFWAADAGL